MKYSGEDLGKRASAPRKIVSPFDDRQNNNSKLDNAVGADRMLHHNYADIFSEYLKPYYERARKNAPSGKLTVCEFGILKGTGLAIWCDLFPESRCLGFDIDLDNVNNNYESLIELGAFDSNHPELYEYDQFVRSEEYLGRILNGDRIDICFDDGCHTDKAILTTLMSVLPHLSDRFVYFIEDNKTIHATIKDKFNHLVVRSRRELTVVTPQ